MLKQIMIAGFGGQGIMSMGQLMVYSGMIEGKEVAWIPSYGPEMRGGTANCSVSISDDPISSPHVTEPDILIAMNNPSLDKFEMSVKNGGVIFINSSLIDRKIKRKDVKVYYISANDKATELGDVRVANMVMLGALLKIDKLVKIDSIMESLKKVLSKSKHHLLPLNAQALEIGAREIGNN
ncbi:MAG: 2-oxoacid:acceptor oxidoreductase family protein [Clostridia bacterium]|nr:2-oxoacid:acceptor oxidoreductase family protein [Clostridia bacterium]MDD4048120.1 2-oxoacid:acceptor oxidoreductase family protein [Clostridia bacterium]